MEQSGPSSSSVSLFGVLIKLYCLFTSAPPPNEISEEEESYSEALPGQNNKRSAFTTCGPSGPLSPPSVTTPKLNLPGV